MKLRKTLWIVFMVSAIVAGYYALWRFALYITAIERGQTVLNFMLTLLIVLMGVSTLLKYVLTLKREKDGNGNTV